LIVQQALGFVGVRWISTPAASTFSLGNSIGSQPAASAAADFAAVRIGLREHRFLEPARAPQGYLEADWGAEPWSAGCVVGTPPGALLTGAVWRGPHGRIHLAGTEAAVLWPGYMEGAIETGERAAGEVLSSASR
jgi:monoamine oxidase